MKNTIISILFGILFTITLVYIPTSLDFNILTLTSSINGYGIFFTLLTLCVSYVFHKLVFENKNKIKFNIYITICSLFLAFWLVIGKYYIHNFSIKYVYNSVNALFTCIPVILINIALMFMYFSALYITLFRLFEYLNNLEIQDYEKTEKKSWFSKFLYFTLEKHSFIIPFLIIVLCGLPYIICFYPGTVQQDGNVQLQQFLGNYGKTSHHPYVSTIILGSLFKLGASLGNDNFGIFTYTYLQFLFSSFVFAYCIDFMKKIKAPIALRIITLIYFSVFTIWPINGITFVKDTAYYLIFLLIVIKVFKLVTIEEKQTSILFNIGLAILCIALCAFRNNGIEVALLTLVALIFLNKNLKRIIILACVIVCLLSYNFIIQPYIYNKVELEKGSIREALSLPIQQVASAVIQNREQLSDENKAFIEDIYCKTLDEIEADYNPEISDPIKNFFEYEPSSERLNKFIGLWFKLLVEHPTTYLDCFFHNYYGYFYPDRTEYKDGLGWYQCSNTEQINVGFNPNFEVQRNNIENFAYLLRNIPLIGLFYSTGIYTWFLLIIFTYLMSNKKYKYVLILIPSILTLVVCLLSPVNAYIRYSQPIMANMPLLLCLLFDSKTKLSKENSKETSANINK